MANLEADSVPVEDVSGDVRGDHVVPEHLQQYLARFFLFLVPGIDIYLFAGFASAGGQTN